ncbi:MAG: hypothetical protein GEV04_23270 [Actinophytocola sp.]|nr:hypothetical protein [Actinophytocola sp.]
MTDRDFLRRAADEHGIPLAAVMSYDPSVADADRAGLALAAAGPGPVPAEIDQVIQFLHGCVVR